jgi:hypothetical protein
VNGKLEGFVTVKNYKADWKYEGEWLDNQPHGQGKITYADNTVYGGEWWRGLPHGQGYMRWPNGSRFTGSWTNGKPNGAGTLRMEDSYNEYTGIWINGCFHQGARKAWIGVTKEDCGFE